MSLVLKFKKGFALLLVTAFVGFVPVVAMNHTKATDQKNETLDKLVVTWNEKERATWQEMKVCSASESKNLQSLPTYPKRKKIKALLFDILDSLSPGLINIIIDYDADGCQKLYELQWFSGSVVAIIQAGYGKIAACLSDGSIQIYDEQQCNIQKLKKNDNFTCLVLLNEKLLVAGSADGSLTAFDQTSGECVADYKEPDDVSTDIQHSDMGIASLASLGKGHVAAGYDFGPIKIWALSKNTFELESIVCRNSVGGVLLRYADYGSNKISTYHLTKPFLFASGEGELVSANAEGQINVWDLHSNETMCCKKFGDTGKNTLVLSNQCFVDCAAMLGKGIVALGLHGGIIKLCDYEAGVCSQTLIDKNMRVLGMVLLPNGLLVVGGSTKDGTGIIDLWDVKGGECVQRIKTKSPVLCLCALPRGKVVSGHADGTIVVYG